LIEQAYRSLNALTLSKSSVFTQKRLSEKMTTMNASNFLKWTSIAIQMENPEYSKSDSMKLAILELKKEKLMRNYIRMVSTHIQKEKPGITKAASIKQAMAEWKAM